MAKPDYYFRIRFILPTGHYFNFDDESIDIPIDGMHFTLRPFDKKKLNETNHLLLAGGPFTSKTDAEKIGSEAKKTLILVTTKLSVGIDLGNDRATGGLSTYLQNKIFKKSGVKIINDVHGLCIYDNIHPVKFARTSSVTLGIGHNDQNFITIFTDCYGKKTEITESEHLAFELYSASFFETTPRVRFLTLVMAVEALLKPKPRIDKAKELVESLISYTRKSEIEPSIRNSLLGSLQWLLQESITKTGKDLASNFLEDEKYLDKNPKQFFSYCYSLRSEFVHQGKTNNETTNLNNVVSELQRFVSDLLNKIKGI